MAQLQQMFDATTVDPSQTAGSLPIGKHPVVITNSEIKSTAKGDSGMLELELTIIDGPAKGTTGPYRLNIYNASEQAKKIANQQLSAICHVTQTFQIQDSSQLHNKPFVIEVGLQKGEDAAVKGYTEVKKVYDMAGNEPGKAPAQGGQQQVAQQPQTAQQPAGQQAGWGQQPQTAQQPAATQQPQTAAWGNQGAAAQQPATAQQPAAAGWNQNAAAGGTPAWGK